MIHDVEDLPRQRTPNLGQSWQPPTPDAGAPPALAPLTVGPPSPAHHAHNEQDEDLAAAIAAAQQQQQPLPSVVVRKPSATVQSLRRPQPSLAHAHNAPSLDEDTASLNSFKTCPSEPNLSFVPRQVADSYASPGEQTGFEGPQEPVLGANYILLLLLPLPKCLSL